MRLANVTPLAVAEYLKHSDMVVIGVGSIENHGKHMPLGTDTLIPDKILELLEARSGVMIAPTVPYGATDSIFGSPGTVTLGVDGLVTVLTRITDSLYSYGFRKFVILNGHGGNVKSIELVGLGLHKKGAWLANLNWWLMAGELNPAWKGGHGGAEETAGVMAVDPALVDARYLDAPMELINDVDASMPTKGFNDITYRGASIAFPRPVHCYSGNGWIGPDKPPEATKEWGDEMVRTMAAYIADFVGDFEKIALPKAEK